MAVAMVRKVFEQIILLKVMGVFITDTPLSLFPALRSRSCLYDIFHKLLYCIFI